jgi:hypothetical protein
VSSTLLLLFVATSDQGGPGLEALSRAVTETLGPMAIAVHTFEQPTPPDEMSTIARARGAVAAARVVWADADRSQASVHVFLVRANRFHEQRVAFQAADPEAERGRALGLVIASYLLPVVERPPPAAPVVQLRVAPPPPPRRWWADAFGATGLARGGAGVGLGAGLGVRLQLNPRWGTRLGFRARVGNVAAAQATLTAASVSAGVFRTLLGDPQGLSLGLRLEGSVLYEALTHFSSDDVGPVRRGRPIPGAAGLVELAIPIGSSAALHLGGGAEVAFGRTDVFVRGLRVAVLAPWRAIAEAGLRVRF